MAYCDYGAFVWLNGKRREDKEDVVTFANDIEIFETSPDNVLGDNWINHIHHGILGDGNIRVVCHKHGLPSIYEVSKGVIKEIKFFDYSTNVFEYEPISFKYNGYEFHFESGRPYYAEMITPNGDKWECKYDYRYGAGF